MQAANDPAMLWVVMFAALSAIATSAAALFSARSARESRHAADATRNALIDAESDARRRATLEQLRGLERRSLPVWRAKIDPEIIVADVERGEPYSAFTANFLAYLNALDLHAFAVRCRMVDRDLSDQYLRDLVPSAPTLLAVITGMRAAAQDAGMYSELELYLRHLRTEFPMAAKPVIERERTARPTSDGMTRGPRVSSPDGVHALPLPFRRPASADATRKSD
ncbi:MAG: hypothetical protein M3081_03375 [Gemmatimonadota bacterium]|nr:hypothetical protein [Gemmatimonadota bacterium]